MLIQIDGWFGSGKGVLWSLLDGHPNVFCSPIHDYSYAAFLNQKNNLDWVKTKHVEILRKALARTQYYKFEKVYWDGFMSFEFSAEDVLKIPYKTNYYEFDKLFISTLMNSKKWTLELIIDTLYKSIAKSNNSKNDLNKYFASMSNPLFIDDYINFPVVFPNAKSIQVRRSVEDIIAVRSNRKPRPEDFKTWTFFSDGFEKRIAEGEVEKILSFYDDYDLLVKKHPNMFKVVDFDELVVNPKPIMEELSIFLNIPFNNQFLMASYQGEELVCNGKKYIGKPNDKFEDLLNVEEIQIIQERKEKYYQNKIS